MEAIRSQTMPLVTDYPVILDTGHWWWSHPMILPCSNLKDILVTSGHHGHRSLVTSGHYGHRSLVTSGHYGHRSLVTSVHYGHWSLEVVIGHTGHACHRHWTHVTRHLTNREKRWDISCLPTNRLHFYYGLTHQSVSNNKVTVTVVTLW